jgi:hypothetical protein
VTREEAKEAILREWYAMSEIERSNRERAATFAVIMAQKYPFRCSGDRYRHIMEWLERSFA